MKSLRLSLLLLLAPAFAAAQGLVSDLNVQRTVRLGTHSAGTINPAQITGDQNNYAPTGITSAFRVRISSDAARTITGLSAGTAGEVKVLTNIGATYTITLADSSGSSTAANQFALAGGDFSLLPDASVMLEYDGTSARWRIYGLTGAALSGSFQPLDAALTALAGGSDFVAFTGPSSATKTFTLPNASATILTDNAAVTAAQGGTGQTSYTTGDLVYASSSSALSKRAIGSTNAFLTVSGGLPAWSSNTLSLGGNVTTGGALTFSGAFGATITVTGTTTVTLPTTGTLAALGGTNTWSGVNTFSNTTDASSALTGAVIISGGLGVTKNAYFTGQLSQIYGPVTFPASTVRGFFQGATGTGDAGGTTNLRALENQVSTLGANSFAGTYALVGSNITGGSAGSVSTAASVWAYGAVTSAQAIGTYNGLMLSGGHSGSANVATAWNGVNISGWSFSSTGDITGTIRGVIVNDVGRAAASYVAGVDIANQTKPTSGNAYGIRSQMTASSGKWSGYFDGTADFYVAGKTGIGIAATTTAQLTLAAGTTGVASLNIPHGSAPSSPVNGDIWTTTAGLFVRINGGTVGPL